MILLDTPVENLSRIGKTVASRLKRLGVFNTFDLIHYFPFRYDDFSNLKNIADLKPGDITTVRGKIELLTNKRSPRKKMVITECFLTDETGSIKAIWFRQPYIAKTLKNGDEVYFSGKVMGDLFSLTFQNPSYEKVATETTHTARLVPIYPLTSGLTQKQLRFLTKQSMAIIDKIEDILPASFKTKYQLSDLTTALKTIHFPENKAEIETATRRLKFNELLGFHLQNYLLKKDAESSVAKALKFKEEETKKIVSNLGFILTGAQKKSAWQILQDMEKTKPMNRLLEGDVGSGKTVVAALAIASATLNKKQTALLAPTEILASQHFKTLQELLKPINCTIGLFTKNKHFTYNTADKKTSKLTKAKLAKLIDAAEINLVVGTHAMLEEKIDFKNLELVIIDEQHRFGVEQRKALREKSGDSKTTPHLLSMTATPIPRTLALTIYGDLNLSIIDELPPGRKKPITKLIEPLQRDKAYEFILEKINEGRQAFVICPLIEESDKLGVKSATEEYNKLSEKIFPQLKIGLLHGRLKPKEKEEVMNKFTEGEINILVATSLIEVGVNVPNASVMVIESAERFGLSQLHQFRGRVNRAGFQAYCLLFSDSNTKKSVDRLKTLVNCFDGFKLAEEDLKLRGSGSFTGTAQSGFLAQFRMATFADAKLIAETKEALEELIKDNPEVIDKFNIKTNIHPE